MSLLKRFRANDRASVMVAFAGASMFLLLAVAGAVELHFRNNALVQLQNAADAASLAGKQRELTLLASTQSGKARTEAEQVAAKTFTHLVSEGRTFDKKPEARYQWNGDGSFTVSSSHVYAMKFSRLLPSSFSRVSTSSTADGSFKAPNEACILVVNPTATQALLINTPVKIDAPNCRIDVYSNAIPAAIFNTGFSHNLKKICVQGSNVIENAGIVPALEKGCTPLADPYAGMLPAAPAGGCTVSDQNYAGNNNLVPGTYCGTFNFNGTGSLNLAPGVYVFKNARWNLNTGWSITGTGVTFYFADENSYVQINSGAGVSLKAPTTGTYKDLLIYEAPGLPQSAFTINGTAGHELQGVIHLPSRDVTFNSVSSIVSESIFIVVGTLILDQIDWKFQSTLNAGNAAGGVSSLRLTR